MHMHKADGLYNIGKLYRVYPQWWCGVTGNFLAWRRGTIGDRILLSLFGHVWCMNFNSCAKCLYIIHGPEAGKGRQGHVSQSLTWEMESPVFGHGVTSEV